MKQAIVFDLDDTLYCEKEYVISGFQEVDRWIRIHLNRQGFFEQAERLLYQGHKGNIFDKVLQTLRIEHDYSIIREMLTIYREHLPRIKLYEDALWALQYVSSKARTGLITDGFWAAQRQKVIALGILPFFNHIVYSDELGRACWKPCPLPYIKMTESLGILPSACVYIGDNPQKDFITAKCLGWTTVQVKREDGLYKDIIVDSDYWADYNVSSLFELRHLGFV
ncbi:HAD family hydrolase [Paenibacillus eucommiae]|uniref:Hydrolase of the HAD superfamily n=1 Tax=Paenibacillus eucommiae TaxID=1355755 RepID=A0ABS4J6W9_9BACL|nr:HAD family hydrolase [Paenibacillus eucommiae]MBP1995573.1 putative hydrolase of the HAD superfamily [Paenibacillus eucommiae]